MSVFSIIKRGRQAKGHTSEKQLGKQKAGTAVASTSSPDDKAPPTKYWHVPTHAATDAMLGAPAGWVRDDFERIRANNRQRTAAASEAGASAASSRATTPSALQMQQRSDMLLSPMHFNVHAGGSSSSSRRSAHWSSSSSSAGIRISHSARSLDAELLRARNRGGLPSSASTPALPTMATTTIPDTTAPVPRTLPPISHADAYAAYLAMAGSKAGDTCEMEPLPEEDAVGPSHYAHGYAQGSASGSSSNSSSRSSSRRNSYGLVRPATMKASSAAATAASTTPSSSLQTSAPSSRLSAYLRVPSAAKLASANRHLTSAPLSRTGNLGSSPLAAAPTTAIAA